MIPRNGKSVLLDTNNDWKINYGTFDVKNPVTLYVKLQTHIIPIECDIDTDSILRSINNYQIPVKSIFSARFIQKTTFASTKVKIYKKSCLVITLTIIQKHGVVSFDDIQPHVRTLINDFICKITRQWEFKFLIVH